MENEKNYYTEQELIAMGVTPVRLTDEQRQKSMSSEGWNNVRKKVFERDGYRSVLSGVSILTEGHETAHHEVYLFHEDGTEFEYYEYIDHLETMISVTGREHMAIHGLVYEYHLDKDYITEDEIAGYNYKSFNYNEFNFINYNRDVDHWASIMKLMVKYGAIPRLCYVVLINGQKYIVDGQNTFTARQKKGLPILYTVIKVTNDDDIQRILLSLNLGGRNFTIKQRSLSFEKQGKEAYIKYNELKSRFNYLTDRIVQMCINNGGISPMWEERFNNGELHFSDLDQINDNLEFLEGLKNLGPNMPKIWSKPAFVNCAICLVKTGQVTYADMLTKFGKAYRRGSSLIGIRTNAKDYYRMIEDVLNFGKREKDIRLEY